MNISKRNLIAVTVILGVLLNFGLPYIKNKLFSNEQGKIDPENMVSSYDSSQKEGVFHGIKVSVPDRDSYMSKLSINDLKGALDESDVLGKKSKEKVIKVSLAEQKLYLYEGSKKKKSFSVSTGLWGTTPTGEFRIWIKLASTLMTGGSKALGTYYYLPNVPWTMYFYNGDIPKWRGYGIHGAYWHNNFGQPMSHGCINMKPEDARIVYDWSSSEQDNGTGTKIVIY